MHRRLKRNRDGKEGYSSCKRRGIEKKKVLRKKKERKNKGERVEKNVYN